MEKSLYILGISIILGGCASLTKTQIESVNQFAETSKDFSAYPSKIMVELANVRLKRAIYYANFYYNVPDKYLNELDSAYNEKNRDYKLSEKVEITFKTIDKYAQSLLLLSSDKYNTDLKEQSNNFGNDIDSLINQYNRINGINKIPSGIGGLVGQVIVFGGDLYIKTKQGNQLKAFVPAADTLIAVMAANLKEFLEGEVSTNTLNQSISIKGLIDNERKGLKEGYMFYLTTCARLNILPTLESENEYLNLKSVLDGLDTLLDQTIAATIGLRIAHSKLLIEIEKKHSLTESIKEIQAYCDDINNIKSTIRKIESSKN